MLDIPVTTSRPDIPKTPIPLRNVVTVEKKSVPTEVTHYNIQPTIELTMGVYGRDLGHVSDDVARVLDKFGTFEKDETGTYWAPFDPASKEKRRLPGSKIVLSGEYLRMKDTFNSLAVGLTLASLLIYFLMVGLDKSFVVPLSVMSIVPLCLIGIMPMLYVTGSAVNVQSLLGFIFIVGIKVANSVLMTDYAQELRRHEGLTPHAGDPQGGQTARPPDHDDGPGRLLRLDSREPWLWSEAARPMPRWPERSWADCWPASQPRCSCCQ